MSQPAVRDTRQSLHGAAAQDVCCSSDSTELLYSKKTELRCCGHRYFNTSLWSCCAGKLSPVQKPGKLTESTFLSMKNLDKEKLCKEVKMGTVESVSVRTIVFNSVLKINGTTATVRALPSHNILTGHDRCNTPKVTPGKTYLFDQDCVLTVINHGSSLQALYFIISKCHHA
ncbi:hypothetical protein INR49_031278 [Caranx melampygus]|nr:hypothetical protein INR49_031278 [Caranx melampygus]